MFAKKYMYLYCLLLPRIVSSLSMCIVDVFFLVCVYICVFISTFLTKAACYRNIEIVLHLTALSYIYTCKIELLLC